MAGYVLRKAVQGDAPVLMIVENQCFQVERIKAKQMYYLLTKAKASTWVCEFEDSAQKQSSTQKQDSSVMQNQVVGYCTIFLPKLPRPARIYSLAVQPKFRGKGLSRKLVEVALDEARAKGYSRVRLEVGENNDAAQSLYLSLGFEVTERLPYYYEDGSHGVRMELTVCFAKPL